jgi:hypothetical protein
MGYGYGREEDPYEGIDVFGERRLSATRAEIAAAVLSNLGDVRKSFKFVMSILKRGVDERQIYDCKAALESLKTLAGNPDETVRQQFLPLFQEDLSNLLRRLEDGEHVTRKITRTLFSILKKNMPELLENVPLIVRQEPSGWGSTVLYQKKSGKIIYISDYQHGSSDQVPKKILESSYPQEIKHIPLIIGMLDEAVGINSEKPAVFTKAREQLGRLYHVLDELGVYTIMLKSWQAPFVARGVAPESPINRRREKPTDAQSRMRSYLIDMRP